MKQMSIDTFLGVLLAIAVLFWSDTSDPGAVAFIVIMSIGVMTVISKITRALLGRKEVE